jgi:hypothetical protein
MLLISSLYFRGHLSIRVYWREYMRQKNENRENVPKNKYKKKSRNVVVV